MTAPPALVHVVWGAGFGGLERLVSDLVRVQAAGGMRVSVLACGNAEGDENLHRYVVPGVEVTGAGLRSGFDLRPSAIRAMAGAMAKADVVHLHAFVPSIAIAARRTGRPLVFTEHGLLGLERKRSLLEQVKQALKGRFLRRRVSLVACVSHWVADVVKAKYRVSEERVHCIPNGVDLAGVRATRSREEVLAAEGVDPSAWVMTVTARLARMKRLDRLLEAAARSGDSGRDWVLLIAGQGPLENALRDQCAALGLDGHVRFLGYRQDVWDLVAAADLVPVPSGLEPFGLVVVEAMALGRPVVAFADSGGPAEIVEQVGGGCLVADVQELAAVISEGRQAGASSRLRSLDQARFQALFDLRRTAAEYARLYATVLQGA